MNQNKYNALIERTLKIIKYDISINNLAIQFVEKKLEISLPEDFKLLCGVKSYESFNFAEFPSFEHGMIKETLEARKLGLPNNYLILSPSDDISLILLWIVSDRVSKVIWCDEQDFFNLCNGKLMEYNPTIFPSFADFYEFLIDEEEKMRAEG